MPRLFTAIELAPDTKAAIARAQASIAARLRRSGTPVRLVPEAQLHLTLVFIGQLDDDRARAIDAAMAAGLTMAPFDLALGGVGVFPPRGRARVLWLGLSQGASAVTQLHGLVAARLSSLGVPGERRPFSPHLTIGRWREGEGPSRLTSPAVTVDAVEQVRAVTLFESRLHPGGAEHVPRLRCALDGAHVDPLH